MTDYCRRTALLLLFGGLAACGRRNSDPGGFVSFNPPLYPNETPELRAMINEYARFHDLPAELIHRVCIRESSHRPEARNGSYYGLMQILPETARGMGYDRPASGLLNAETNLRYAGAYLKGAWIVSNGDIDDAIGWYARGYYYEARDRCLLVRTGLRSREVSRNCS